jgi:hypothetical protein
MQEHIAKKLRLSILLWLMLLAAGCFLMLVDYYEQQQAFQWEEMVQPHWEAENISVAIATAEQDVADESAVNKNAVEPVVLEAVALEAAVPETIVQQEPEIPVPEKLAVSNESNKKKVIPKTVAKKKSTKLALKLPENLYHGEVPEWEEKKPVVIPDFFVPKKGPERVQLGGRLIIDEEPKKKQNNEESASYLDALQGAELNISIKVP